MTEARTSATVNSAVMSQRIQQKHTTATLTTCCLAGSLPTSTLAPLQWVLHVPSCTVC